MCQQCSDGDCAYDDTERHPDAWPDGADCDEYPDDLPEPQSWHDGDGKPCDSNGTRYNPYQGSVSQTDGRCNALLTRWKERYGEARYCMAMPESTFLGDEGSDYCRSHKHNETNEALMERAREAFTHGLFSKSIRHVFDKLQSWQQLSVLGRYDAYVSESHYEYAPTVQSHTIDFSDYDGELPLELAVELDDDECMDVGVPIPTEHQNRAYALYRAALSDVKSGLAERSILDTDSSGAMERETVVDINPETGEKYTEMEEHHLNLSLSRLDKDRKELLQFGGIPLDTDDGADVSVESPEQLIVDLDDVDSGGVESEPTPLVKQMDDADGVDGAGDADKK